MSHLQRLQERLRERQIDALLIEDTTNLYYLTELDLSAGTLLMFSSEVYLIVDGRYYEQCAIKTDITVILAEDRALENLLADSVNRIRTLGFLSEETSYQRYLELQKLTEKITFTSKGQQTLSLIPTPNLIKELRSVKDAGEIEKMHAAAALGKRGLDYVQSILKEGISEMEIAKKLEIFWLKNGGDGSAFPPIIAIGPNSSMPHYKPGTSTLHRGQHVLVDIGVTLNHYHSDMTRVFFFDGIDPEMKRLYQIIQDAQKVALALCKPGTRVGDLDDAARSWIKSEGFGEYFTHSLGHGIGLEVHEQPILRNKPPYQDVLLAPGMVITIEPGIYLPGRGGVRFEDTIVITSSGYLNLTI